MRALVLLLLLVLASAASAGEAVLPGVVGDGRSHPIGDRLGASLAALAAFTDRAGARPFTWIADPAFGLAFRRATSAAQDAPGTRLAFATTGGGLGDAAGIIAPGMTVAAECLPPGDMVARVGPDAIVLTRDSVRPCAAGTLIRFAVSAAAAGRLEADWLGLQAALVAASAAGGALHIPAGDYVLNRPLMVPGGGRGGRWHTAEIAGDGMMATRLHFPVDLGPGVCGLGEADRAPGSAARASIHDLRLIGPGRRGALGRAPAAMDGACIGSKQLLRRVRAEGFRAGANVVGDHWEIEDSELTDNLYGVYLAPGSDTFGNGVLRDVFPAGNLLAGIAVSAGNTLDSATLRNVHLGFSPYGFYREAAARGGPVMHSFITNSVLENVWGESLGNGYIRGENGAQDRVARNVWINCRPVMNTPNYRLDGAGPRAMVRVGSWSGNRMIDSDFGHPDNQAAIEGALIEAAEDITGNDFGRAPDMVAGSSPLRPALRAPLLMSNTFETGNAQGRFAVAVVPLGAGQILAERGADQVAPNAPGGMPAGVALAAAGAGEAVPVADRGIVAVAKAPTALRRGERLRIDPNAPTQVTGAGAAAAFALAWQDAAADAGQVTAFLPSLSAAGR